MWYNGVFVPVVPLFDHNAKPKNLSIEDIIDDDDNNNNNEEGIVAISGSGVILIKEFDLSLHGSHKLSEALPVRE